MRKIEQDSTGEMSESARSSLAQLADYTRDKDMWRKRLPVCGSVPRLYARALKYLWFYPNPTLYARQNMLKFEKVTLYIVDGPPQHFFDRNSDFTAYEWLKYAQGAHLGEVKYHLATEVALVKNPLKKTAHRSGEHNALFECEIDGQMQYFVCIPGTIHPSCWIPVRIIDFDLNTRNKLQKYFTRAREKLGEI